MNKKQIIKRVKYWKNVFNLNDWDILVTFNKQKNKKETKDFVLGGHTVFNVEYLLATINFPNPKELEENTIKHELLHIILGEMHSYILNNCDNNTNNWYNHFNERAIVRLERIIEKLK